MAQVEQAIVTLLEKGTEKNWLSLLEEGLQDHLKNLLAAYQTLVSSKGMTHGVIEDPDRKITILVPDHDFFSYTKPEGIDQVTVHIPLGVCTSITYDEIDLEDTAMEHTLLLAPVNRDGNFDGAELRVARYIMGNSDSVWTVDLRSEEDRQSELHMETHTIFDEPTYSPTPISTTSYATIVQNENGIRMGIDPLKSWEKVLNKPDSVKIVGLENNFVVVQFTSPRIEIATYDAIQMPHLFTDPKTISSTSS